LIIRNRIVNLVAHKNSLPYSLETNTSYSVLAFHKPFTAPIFLSCQYELKRTADPIHRNKDEYREDKGEVAALEAEAD
jgi:hypothetical protein